ncbi:transglutaminase domain-containing protein [uncultured Tenacibaculum sp.]|uniref:transglutaminase-like domain-containing protein n=1 Tax=uncultured Tenacibaculum sp. TaxID=174713 RepID=UPI00262F62BA|nr:transglutaminase domain-containing protein [uncultured Tenacibaculum sp.]
MKNKLFLALIFLIIKSVSSQDINKLIQKYPNEDVVGLNLSEHLFISLKKNKLDIKRVVNKRKLYITNEKKSSANTGVYYDNFHEIYKIEASTNNINNDLRNRSRRNNHIWKVDDYSDKDIISNGIFFGDQKQKTFTFPAVTEKSITNLDYSINTLDPHFIHPFYLSNNFPIANAEFSVTVQKGIEIAYKSYNLDTINVEYSKKVNENSTTTYKWKFLNIPKAKFNYDFSPVYYLPQIAVFVKSYEINGEKKNVLNNVSDLYGWYQSLITNINKTNQEEIKNITANLIKGLKTDEEKIKAIYYFVQEKINYIAFEDGLNGFIPRDAANVFTKKYGDCKDMANILNEMLKYANIPSFLTWIGTRSKPYSYYELPTTYTDNHMITTVKVNNKFLFLDATAEYLPFGYPSPFIQGKEALIGISKNDFKISVVEEVEKEKNYSEIKSEFNFNEDFNLKGKHVAKTTGYKKLDFSHAFDRKKDKDKDFIRTFFKLGNHKTTFTTKKLSGLSLKNDTVQIQFESNFKNHVRKIDNQLFIKLNTDKLLTKELVKHERKKYAKKIDYKYVTKYLTSFKIPEGYINEFIPKNSSFENPKFGFEINYKIDNNYIILEKKIYINTLKITVEEIDTWNTFIKKLSRNNKKSIILKKL